MGDPRLLERVAATVERFGTPRARRRCSRTCATRWRAQNGAGLAAPQIGVPLRVVIFGVEHNPRYPDAEPVPYTELVNPVLTPLTDEMEEGWEGCLSVPGLRGVVPRYTRCATRASIRTASAIEREVDGFHARVVQHECDHLDGILYPMRMRDLRRSASPTCCFPDASTDESSRLSERRPCRRRRVRVMHSPQLLVQRGLEPQQRLLVVQPRAVDQEHVLGALAQRVDLRAGDVDVGAAPACRRCARAGPGRSPATTSRM